MERKNGKIVNSPDEQTEFNVPAEIDLDIAVDTAFALKDAAQKVWNSGETLTYEVAEDENSQVLDTAHKRQSRAVRLNMYAAGVLDLCPDIVAKKQRARR